MATQKSMDHILDDPAPVINNAPSTEVELLCGLFDPENNEWQTIAQVRELNGEDEEFVAAAASKKELTYAEYMSVLLKRSVVSIGSIDVSSNPSVLDNLIVGDRDVLFVGTVKATYGRVRELEATCSQCEATNYIQLNLDEDFKVDKPRRDPHKPLVVKLKNGSVVKLRYPTGADSQEVTKKAKTVAEQNTIMLARCSVWDGDEPNDKEAWAKSLSLGDRNKLVKALTTDVPGPRLEEVKTQCADCGSDLILVMDWVSLLFG